MVAVVAIKMDKCCVNDENIKEIAWIEHFKEFFSVVEVDEKNVRLQCSSCLPMKCVLSTSKISPANLIKHVEVISRFFYCLSIIHYILRFIL